MDTANLFPVFSQLHTDDPPVPIGERPAPKICANEAGLFLVTAQTISEADESEETQDPSLRITGDLPVDTVMELHCMAFLKEFFDSLEPGDLRRIAEELRDDKVRP
jgi:hypothetical protein